MRRQLVHQALIVLAAAILFFTNLGRPALWDEDEPLYASAAREMLVRGDWVVPTYNGQLFAEKPVLVYWSIIAGFKMFGVNELGARFWSAALAVATVLVTYSLGRRLFGEGAGLWGALAVASSLLFTVSARAATVDSALVLASISALWIFASGGLGKQGSMGGDHCPSGDCPASEKLAAPWFIPGSWTRFVAFYACLAVAVLAKGPVGLLVPSAAIGLFVMIMNRRAEVDARGGRDWPEGKMGILVRAWRLCGPGNFLRSLWQMRPLTGAAVVLAIAGPWYLLVSLRTGGEWLGEFFGIANWAALTGSRQGHGGPLWYYLPATMIGFFPWSVLLLPAVIDLIRRIRNDDPQRPACVLAACWLGVTFAFWSLCGTKLPHYVLPAYPVLALVVGALVDAWIHQPQAADRRRFRTALGIVVFVGLGMAVAVPIVTAVFVPGEEVLGLVGGVLLIGGAMAFWLAERQRRPAAAAALALTAVAFVTSIFGFAALRIDRHQFARPLLAETRRQSGGQPQFAGFRFIRESLVFYAGGPVTFCQSGDQLRRFLDRSEHPCVVTTDEHRAALEELAAGQLTLVARRGRFLREGEVLVFARPGGSLVPQVAGRMSGGRAR